MRDDNVFGEPIASAAENEADDWQRKYLLVLALGYAELRERLFMIRRARGGWLLAAQITFLLFLFSVAILALVLVI
jgi:hypothetical protein